MADLKAIRARLAGEVQHRAFTLGRGTVDEAARTVALSFSSEEPYRRWFGNEILDHSPGSVDLSRLNDSASLLVNHDADRHVGVVMSARVDRDKVGRALVRFGRSELAQEVFRDIQDGIRSKVSVGYTVNDLVLEKQEGDIATYRAMSWSPRELSIVSVPADSTVGVGRSLIEGKSMASRSQRAATQREYRRRATLLVPPGDRESFWDHLERELDDDEPQLSREEILAAYEAYRCQSIRSLAGAHARIGADKLIDPAIDEKSSVANFREQLMDLVESKQSRPTVTGQLEVDRAARVPYGEGVTHDGFRAIDYAMGQWMRSRLGDQKAHEWCLHNLQERVMTEGVFTAGGAAVPTQIANEIISNVEQYGAYRAVARQWPMTSASLAVPVSMQGLTMGVVGETSATTASDLALQQVMLVAKEFSGGIRISRSLMEDSVAALGSFLIQELSRVLAQTIDGCGFVGDGTSTYGGMMGLHTRIENDSKVAGSKVSATSTHVTLAAVDIADVVKLMAACPEYAKPRARWMCSSTVRDSVLTRLAMTAGANTSEGIQGGLGQRFMGYPIVVSQSLPSVATNGKVFLLFGDPTMGCAFGERRQILIEVDESVYRAYRQYYIQISSRFDCVNHLAGATPTAAGPVVGLAGLT